MDDTAIQFNLMQTILLWAIPLLFAITVHETAHGVMANKLGDPTAKMLGRLTLNPLKHIDLFGTIVLPALTVWLGGFLFGWAKPVPITWRRLRHIRRDMALVALAGPAANFLMAFFWVVIVVLGKHLEAQENIYGIVFDTMGSIGIQVNCMLFLVNLLPIQPLDGGRILSSLLPGKFSYYFDRLEPYGIFILLFLIITHTLSAIIMPAYHILASLFYALIEIGVGI